MKKYIIYITTVLAATLVSVSCAGALPAELHVRDKVGFEPTTSGLSVMK